MISLTTFDQINSDLALNINLDENREKNTHSYALIDLGLGIHSSMSRLKADCQSINTSPSTVCSSPAKVLTASPSTSQADFSKDSSVQLLDDQEVIPEIQITSPRRGTRTQIKLVVSPVSKGKNSSKKKTIPAEKNKDMKKTRTETPKRKKAVVQKRQQKSKQQKPKLKPAAKEKKDDDFLEIIEVIGSSNPANDLLPISQRLRDHPPKNMEVRINKKRKLEPSTTNLTASTSTKNEAKKQKLTPTVDVKSNKLAPTVTVKSKKSAPTVTVKSKKLTPKSVVKKSSKKLPKNDNLPPTSPTDNDLLDLDTTVTDDDGVDGTSNEQIRQLKWDNLKLREHNADLLDENERNRNEIEHLRETNYNQKTELFKLRVEIHELRSKNMELSSKNQVPAQDSASVTKNQESVHNEPETFRTKDRIDGQLSSNDVKMPRRMSIAVDQISKRTRQKKAGQVESAPEVVTLQ